MVSLLFIGSVVKTGTFLALVMGWFSSSSGTSSVAEVEAVMLQMSESALRSIDLTDLLFCYLFTS